MKTRYLRAMRNSRRRSAGTLVLTVALAVVIGAAGLPSDTPAKAPQRQICITFDELPVAESFGDMDALAVLHPILDTLTAYEVRAAGFVVGKNIGKAYDLLGQWLNNGHRLGNITFTHSDLHEMGLEAFIKDIRAGHEALETMLSGFGQKPRFFRYPYLHYGEDAHVKLQVALYLEEQNTVVVPATIVVEDYLYNLSLQKLGSRPDSAALVRLLNEYVNHVLDRVERSEHLSQQLLGRNCRHILQLRANSLNALFLGELLTALRDLGYSFITIDRAMKDELYSMPEAYFGPRGVGYLDMIKQSDPDRLPAQ